MLVSKIKNAALATIVLSVFVFSTAADAQTKSSQSLKGAKSTTTLQSGTRFVDADGDGLCDNAASGSSQNVNGTCLMDGSGRKSGMGKGKGLNSGSGTCTGTGVCDGTGPKGNKASN
ncbi:MAG: hypothetical protein WCJ01_02045 [Ignavibacteria bacterium]